MNNYCDISELKNKIVKNIDLNTSYSDELIFECESGERYKMFHQQDCCESVDLNEVIGDLTDLIGSPILEAEMVTNQSDSSAYESFTWTFYKLSTIKGSVTLRWYGTSNGYYSEEVDFVRLD